MSKSKFKSKPVTSPSKILQQTTPYVDNSTINFKTINKNLYDTTAEYWAKEVHENGQKKEDLKEDKINSRINSYTQVRMFYDDIEKFYALSQKLTEDNQEDFENKILPLFLMLNSKVKYASGRGLVTQKFVAFVNTTVSLVDNKEDLETCKTFWEAFMGFYRYRRPTSKQKTVE